MVAGYQNEVIGQQLGSLSRCPMCNAVLGQCVSATSCRAMSQELRRIRHEGGAPAAPRRTSEPPALDEHWRLELRAGVEQWERDQVAAIIAFGQAQLRLDALLYAAARRGADVREISDATELRLAQVRERIERFLSGLSG